MNLRQIEVFRSLMTQGSVSAAAEFLNVSQPGVSRLIRNLEERSSVRLFNRVKGRLEPTPEARTLQQEIEGAFVQLERVRSVVARLAARQSGLVRVVAAHTLAHSLVLDRLLSIRRDRPNLRLAIDYAPFRDMRHGLETGHFDFGLVIGEEQIPDFQHRRVATLKFVLALDRGHRLAQAREATAKDLADEPVISYRRGSPLFEALARRGLRSVFDASTLEVGSSLIACGAVERGWGVAIVDTDTVERGRFQNLVTVPFKPQVEVPILVHYRKEALAATSARSTLAALCSDGDGP